MPPDRRKTPPILKKKLDGHHQISQVLTQLKKNSSNKGNFYTIVWVLAFPIYVFTILRRDGPLEGNYTKKFSNSVAKTSLRPMLMMFVKNSLSIIEPRPDPSRFIPPTGTSCPYLSGKDSSDTPLLKNLRLDIGAKPPLSKSSFLRNSHLSSEALSFFLELESPSRSPSACPTLVHVLCTKLNAYIY